MKLTELDPLEVARQLSLMDSKIFNQIKHAECIEKAWSTPESIQVSPNIRELIERSNRVCFFFFFQKKSISFLLISF